MKRLFISIPLDRETEEVLSEYRDTYGRIGYVRWTAVQNLHVTVLFIGAVAERHVEALSECLRGIASRTAPFILPFEKVQYAPPGRQAKMIWAYFRATGEFESIVQQTFEGVSSVVAPEERFKRANGNGLIAHVTLARFKDKVPPRELIRLKQPDANLTALTVSEIVLMESRLRREGAEYVPLEAFPLMDR